MRFIIAVAITALCAQYAMAIVCPPNFCDSQDCSSVQAELESCEGRVQKNGGFCGCCDSCITQLNEGDACFEPMFGTPKNKECGPGLECHPTQKTCQKLIGSDGHDQQPHHPLGQDGHDYQPHGNAGPCHKEYIQKMSQIKNDHMMGAELPDCEADGTYKAVQCQEAVCMCVNQQTGKQIEQFSGSVGQVNDMNCQCAIDKDRMKISMLYTEFNCASNGNYNPVQCTYGSECWCVDPMGKEMDLFGRVDKGQETELGDCSSKGPCHDEWLRDNAIPPTSMIIVQKPQCEADGSYTPKQCRGSVCMCVDTQTGVQDNTIPSVNIGQQDTLSCSPKRSVSKRQLLVPADPSTQPCLHELQMIEFGGQRSGNLGTMKPQCLPDGTYHPRQCREAVCMCVDSMGKPIGRQYMANVGKANQMSCECARQEADFHDTGMVGQTFNCDNLGNFKDYKCVGSVCYCIDEHGNQETSKPSVSIGQLEQLDCSKETQGACAQELEMIEQQTQLLGARKPQCMEDGSYHPRQCFGSVCTCVDSDGGKTDYKASISQASEMGCQCARDLYDYMNSGMIGKLFYCDDLGNYKQQ